MKEEVPRRDVLYDKDTLRQLNDKYGPESEIKRNVRTSATMYEIRTALRYWFGGEQTHRTSSRIWNTCEAVDNGMDRRKAEGRL